MGRRDRPEHKWVLDYHMPGARSEPRSTLGRGDDDEDEPGGDESSPPVAAGVVIEQLHGLYGPGESDTPLAAEVVRCVGDDVTGVDLVMPGEVRGPLGGALATVRVDPSGRCLLSVPDGSAEICLARSPGKETSVATPVEGLEVPPSGRALVRSGEATLLVRLVTPPAAPRPSGGPLRLALVAVLVVALVTAFVLLVRWAHGL